MLTVIRVLALAFVVVLSGCAATVTRQAAQPQPLSTSAPPKTVALQISGSPTAQASEDWQAFRDAWREAFAEAAANAGMQFVSVEAGGSKQAPGTVLARVSVSDFRYVSTGARYGLGVMTGNAHINAQAEFIEYPSGKNIGTRSYSTSSSAWQGIFSAMTSKQVASISQAMIQDLQGK